MGEVLLRGRSEVGFKGGASKGGLEGALRRGALKGGPFVSAKVRRSPPPHFDPSTLHPPSPLHSPPSLPGRPAPFLLVSWGVSCGSPGVSGGGGGVEGGLRACGEVGQDDCPSETGRGSAGYCGWRSVSGSSSVEGEFTVEAQVAARSQVERLESSGSCWRRRFGRNSWAASRIEGSPRRATGPSFGSPSQGTTPSFHSMFAEEVAASAGGTGQRTAAVGHCFGAHGKVSRGSQDDRARPNSWCRQGGPHATQPGKIHNLVAELDRLRARVAEMEIEREEVRKKRSRSLSVPSPDLVFGPGVSLQGWGAQQRVGLHQGAFMETLISRGSTLAQSNRFSRLRDEGTHPTRSQDECKIRFARCASWGGEEPRSPLSNAESPVRVQTLDLQHWWKRPSTMI